MTAAVPDETPDPVTAARPEGAEAVSRKKPLLCRLGIHTLGYSDGGMCWSVVRCHRCHRPVDQVLGERLDNCRRMVSDGSHPERGSCW